MSTTQKALTRAIVESPEDPTPRLVLADWLEERGESDRTKTLREENGFLVLYKTTEWYEPAMESKIFAAWRVSYLTWADMGPLEITWPPCQSNLIWTHGHDRNLRYRHDGKWFCLHCHIFPTIPPG